MTFVNESCFATVPSCTVSGFLSGIHTVMTFALKKQKRLCRRTVLCGQQTGFTPVEENSLVMTFASESGFATMLWSKHFATQNGLRPPRFLRGAYFAVHWSELCFAKWLRHRIYLCGSLLTEILKNHLRKISLGDQFYLLYFSSRYAANSAL